MNNSDFKDTRILEAFDYIDPKYIAEVAESLKLKSVRTTAEAPEMTWRTPFKHWKQFVALAACLLLLAFASPVLYKVVEVISSFAAGWGSGTSEGNTDLWETTNNNEDYLFGDYLKPIKNLEPLNVSNLEMINRITDRSIKIDELNSSLNSIRYFGTIDNYVVLWENGVYDSSHTIGIAGFDFYDSSSFEIYVYKSGERMRVEEAYMKGIINDAFINILYLRNNEYISYFTNREIAGKIPINDDDLERINISWSQMFGEGEKYAVSLDEVQLGNQKTYCYGKFGDAIVFRAIDIKEFAGELFIDYEVGTYVFQLAWPSTQIWVYYDEELITLKDAFDRNILSESELMTIFYRHSYSYY